jgi:hypothetical protein
LHLAERQSLIAKTVSLFQQQQPHRAQHFAAGYRRPLVRTRPDQQEVFLEQRDLDEGRFRHRQGDDGRVKPAFDELL